MIAFVDLDKLRLAEKITQFKKDNPNVEIEMQIYEDFVTKRRATTY